MSDDLLEAGARRTLPGWSALPGWSTLPGWTPFAAALVAVVALVAWAVVALQPPVLDGHGSGPVVRVPTNYQPHLGRPNY